MRTAVIDARATASLLASGALLGSSDPAASTRVRVGLVVPRYKHSAVDRNTLKRRLREIVRQEWLPVLPPIDVVLRVTPPAYERDFEALQREMRQLVNKLQTAWPRTD